MYRKSISQVTNFWRYEKFAFSHIGVSPVSFCPYIAYVKSSLFLRQQQAYKHSREYKLHTVVFSYPSSIHLMQEIYRLTTIFFRQLEFNDDTLYFRFRKKYGRARVYPLFEVLRSKQFRTKLEEFIPYNQTMKEINTQAYKTTHKQVSKVVTRLPLQNKDLAGFPFHCTAVRK